MYLLLKDEKRKGKTFTILEMSVLSIQLVFLHTCMQVGTQVGMQLAWPHPQLGFPPVCHTYITHDPSELCDPGKIIQTL